MIKKYSVELATSSITKIKNRSETMKRAYGLSRVSTINQEHNTSIEHQREKISQYSNLNNFNLVDVLLMYVVELMKLVMGLKK